MSCIHRFGSFHASVIWLISVASTAVLAQPPVGPYGPLGQRYDIPADGERVFHVAPHGVADADGLSVDEPTTIEAAISLARTGDTIVLRGGVYRTGELVTNQGVTMQPYADERPVLMGTRIATEWEPVRGGLWRTRWEPLFPASPEPWYRREREVTRTPLHRFNNDMVFVDGRLLRSAAWAGEVDDDSFWIDYDEGYVYVAADPSEHSIEITAHDIGLLRSTEVVHNMEPDNAGLHVKGITFTRYAFRAVEIQGVDPEGVSSEADHGTDVIGSTFEHCEFSYCSRVAGYFRGDGLVIRHCLVKETGTEGLFILASDDVLLERNIVTRNNNEDITGYYVSAIKIFNQCHRVVCRENLIVDNPGQSSGVWYDVGNVDGVFINNRIERTDNGFFFEISKGAICAGNVFVECTTGVHILNSSDVRVLGNTLVNSRLRVVRTTRGIAGDHFGWHPSTGPGIDERHGHEVSGNLFYADESFEQPLLQVEQGAGLVGMVTSSQLMMVARNAYVRRDSAAASPLITWVATDGTAAAYTHPSELAESDRGFGGGSEAWIGERRQVFVGERLGQFELAPGTPVRQIAPAYPDEIRELMGWSGSSPFVAGAFQE